MRWLMGFIVAACLALSTKSGAQYLFLDSNGDEASTEADVVSNGVDNLVSVWIVTDRGRDGRTSSLRTPSGGGPTINSYSFILRAVGGTVDWGTYTNAMPSMTSAYGSYSSPTEFYTGHGGGTILPPGRFRLGDLHIRAISGNPRIEVVDASAISTIAMTTFGSAVPGVDEDNTLKFRVGGKAVVNEVGRVVGDWFEADGLRAASKSNDNTLATRENVATFAVSVTPNPANPAAEFRVSTTQPGRIRIALFNPQGRLLRLVANVKTAPAGMYHFPVAVAGRGTSLGSGVVFYRVETTEGNVTGKFLILK